MVLLKNVVFKMPMKRLALELGVSISMVEKHMEGVDGLYIEKEDRDGQLLHILWWSNGDMAYCIMGTFPRDEIMRFAQGVGRQ